MNAPHAGHLRGRTDDHAAQHGHGYGHLSGGVPGRVWGAVTHLFTPHSHDSADRVDTAMESSRDGMRALWISLAVLGT